MNGYLGTVLLAASGPAAPSKELPEAAKKELKALEGKWRVVKFLHSDRDTTPGTGEDEVTVEFKGNTIDFAKAATGVVAELDPATDPKCLDFKAQVGSGVFKKDSTYESVYKLDGDTLTWAVYVGRGKNRPVAFDKPTDAGVMVMVLNRIKE
ncbi:MAG TPA: TIGR03067 domain-containing protein [Gemmataceae bacterium]|nr:TIGR03067 domain-containing protein [Gemmataceae bacterium]